MHLLERAGVPGVGDLPAALGLDVAVLVEGRTAEVHTEIGDDDLILELPDAGGGAVVVDVDLGMMAGMARQELFSDAFGAVCRKDDPLALEWPQLTWDRIGKVNLIANGLCDQITDPSFVQLLNRSRLRVLNTTTLLGLVREGVGITILPRLAISGLLDDLAFLPLTDVTARRSVFMVSAPKNILMPPAKAFQDTINKMIRDESFVKFQKK